jgi:hypothetical protein
MWTPLNSPSWRRFVPLAWMATSTCSSPKSMPASFSAGEGHPSLESPAPDAGEIVRYPRTADNQGTLTWKLDREMPKGIGRIEALGVDSFRIVLVDVIP